jgi:hypothetical protein
VLLGSAEGADDALNLALSPDTLRAKLPSAATSIEKTATQSKLRGAKRSNRQCEFLSIFLDSKIDAYLRASAAQKRAVPGFDFTA